MNIKELFADKLMISGDTVGATLSRAGFPIQKNKKRDVILTQVARETDSAKMLIAAEVFSQ